LTSRRTPLSTQAFEEDQVVKREELLARVREILFREWDPIGVKGYEACRDEYDSYAPTLVRHLREGADEHRIAAHLTRLARDAMGLSVVDQERDRRVARRLLDILG
jgi:hypothetical protein